MTKIRGEIENLIKQTTCNKIPIFCLQEDKAKAKKQAMKYSELENELTLLNLVLQINLRHSSYEDVLTDIIDAKRNNEEYMLQLEGLFDLKKQLEELLMDMKEKNKNCCSLQIELPVESDACIKIRNKIMKTKEAINRYRRISEQSFFRKKRSQLLLEYNACIARRNELTKECDTEIVLHTLKQNKEQIKELEIEKKQLECDLQQLKDDMKIIANMESSKEKYQVSSNLQELFKKISNKENTIQSCLDYLFLKNEKPDVFCDIISTTHIITPHNFLEHMKKLHNYQEEYTKQLEYLVEKKSELQKFQDLEQVINKLSERRMQTEENKKSLQVNLAAISANVEGLRTRLKGSVQLLEQDQRYVELRELDENLKRLLEENSKLENIILKGNCVEQETLSKETNELVKKYNQKLIEKLKGKCT